SIHSFSHNPSIHPTSTSSRPRAARQPCANPKCTERGHPTGHRNLQCRSGYCKTCCQETTMRCPAPRHNEPITAAFNSITVTPRKDRTQAAPATPSAAASIFSFERPMAKRGHDINYTDRVQHDQYRKQNLSSVQIKWWAQNGAEPQVFTVNAPAYPFFHPKDSQSIVQLVGLHNCLNYGYWDGSQWLLTDVPVRVQTQSAIFMRSPDVIDCPGAPRPKRHLSDSDHPSTPTPTRQKSFNSNDNTTNTMSQLTLTKPNSIISISSTESGDDSVRSIATQIVFHRRESIPREFAQDMDGGFRAMDSLTGTVPHRFTEVFQNKFAHGTFYSHFNTWKAMSESDEGKVLQKAVDSGTGAEGSWTRLLKRFGKTSAK
ncbi:hypothetical protein R3P38DRAFT_2950420, partial [Favolaschia claudopus]